MVLHPDSLSSFVWSRYIWSIFFCNWTLSTRLLEKQADYQRRLYELYRGVLGMLPGKNFGELDSLKRHILHSLDRTQLIFKGILLSFSQSLVIHESRAEVPERIMIPEFLKQRFMVLTCFVSMIHDSWFHSHPRYFLMLPEFIPSFSLIFTDVVFLILRCAATTCPSAWLLRYCRMSVNRVDDLGENAKPQPFAPVDTPVAALTISIDY